ncbi:MAG: dihydrofolate reductase family protein [Chloroflexota bacterium]|nr:dihydrofolate reductase family protein [Chloroflexota bacterium]
MRKIALTEFISLDGVIEAPHEWHFQFSGEDAGQYKLDELFATDALLLGRVTYEGFASAWPEMTDEQGFADRFNSIPKYVVSTTLENPEWNNSHVIRGNLAEEIGKLKRESGQDIVIHGSGKLANSLMAEGLIDEYRLMVHPVVVGKGQRLFEDGTALAALDLVDSRPLSNGVILLTYVPTDPPAGSTGEAS